MLQAQTWIEDVDGNVLVRHIEDHTHVAQLNHEEKQSTGGWTEGREMRQVLRVPAREYSMWEQRYPGCWSDPAFVRSYVKENPEYSTIKGGSI